MSTFVVPHKGTEIAHISQAIQKPQYIRAVQVHVWKNRTKALGLIPDAGHPGHAAMQVWENREIVRYVSWWPTQDIGKETKRLRDFGQKRRRISIDGTLELGPSAHAKLQGFKVAGTIAKESRERQYLHAPEKELENDRLVSEESRWMQLPENSVSLPGMGAQGIRWGLNLPGIARWWDDKGDCDMYVMQSTTQNCSGAVAEALRAGGAECYVPAPIAWLVLTPAAIALWAQKLEERLRILDQHAKELSHQAGHANLREHGLPGESLPKKEEWVKASSVLGKPRSSALRAIDSALGEYHRFGTGEFNVDQHKQLVQLVEAIYTHVQTRPASERHKWVLSLSQSALSAVYEANHHVNEVLPK